VKGGTAAARMAAEKAAAAVVPCRVDKAASRAARSMNR